MNTILLKCMDVESSGLTFIDVLDIVSKFAILLTLIGLLASMRQTRRVNYITCTAKYTNIQQLFLTNKHLAPLHLRIYGVKLKEIYKPESDPKPKDPKDELSKEEKFNVELALSSMLFQLMEDVWVINGRSWKPRFRGKATYEGWERLFNDWMSTPEIGEKWSVLKFHYDTDFIGQTERHYRLGKS